MNEETINKLIDYSMSSLDDTTLLIQHYGNMIEYYRKMIKMTEENKPFFFQKKKMTEYNDKLKEYNDELSILYGKLESKIT